MERHAYTLFIAPLFSAPSECCNRGDVHLEGKKCQLVVLLHYSLCQCCLVPQDPILRQ